MKIIKGKNSKGRETCDFIMSAQEYKAMQARDEGICCGCGAVAYGVEPDAARYECESCGAKRVYGVPELLVMDKIRFEGME